MLQEHEAENASGVISQLEVGDGFRLMTWLFGQERFEVMTGLHVFNSCSVTECTLAYLPKVNSSLNDV